MSVRSIKVVNPVGLYRKEWNEKHGTWNSKPLHDHCSHGADAFRYGASAADPVVVDFKKINPSPRGRGRHWMNA